MNLRMTTMTVEKQRGIINLDSGDFLFHLKAFTDSDFNRWIKMFRLCQNAPLVTFESFSGSLGSQMGLDSSTGPNKSDQMDLSLKERSTVLIRLADQLGIFLTELRTSQDDIVNQQLEDLQRNAAYLRQVLTSSSQLMNDITLLRDMVSKLSQSVSLVEALSSYHRTQEKRHLWHLQKLEPLIRQVLTESQGRSRYGNRSIFIDALGQEKVYNRFSSTTSLASDHYFDALERFEGTVDYEEYTAESDESEDFFEEEVSSSEEEEEVKEASTRTSLKRDLEMSEQLSRTLQRRKVLARPISEGSTSLFSFLRQNLGKDLSKISMPVHFNEPLSVLQRLAEELEYCELLDMAVPLEHSMDRLLYASLFAISGYTSSVKRTRKPFNPILGETYELMRADKGFRYIAEKVSHHPLVVACHADSENYEFWQTSTLKTKFWGKSMELIPEGTVHVTLPSRGDHFIWNKVTTCVRNLLSSNKWVEHYGEMVVTNVTTQEYCKIVFKESGSLGYGSKHEFMATLHTASGDPFKTLVGKWNEAIYEQIQQDQLKLLWRPIPLPEDSEKYYGFTQFALELNELTPDLASLLPLTDSRFRRDQRFIEEGRLDEAEKEKQRLEQRQRELRKQMEQLGQPYQPRWFAHRPIDTSVDSLLKRCQSVRRNSLDDTTSTKTTPKPSVDEHQARPSSLLNEEWHSNKQYWIARSKKAYPSPFVPFGHT